jgi:probable F420-dependent oxidoreductase
MMRLGVNLPQIGRQASPQLFAQAARRAEALGLDTVWMWERVLRPVQPQTPYPGTPDGSFPGAFTHAWDPLTTLAFVAGQTTRIGLGTSVLDIPYYNPVMLARAVASLDVLSGGRARLGLGLGWSKDEFDAVGASLGERGARADEFLKVLIAAWTTDPVEFAGKHYRVPRSVIGLKPVQKPHPPVYLAAFAPAALARTGRLANGWNPTLLPPEAMQQMIGAMREAARAAGRDPASLEVVVRANLHETPRALGADRAPFAGSMEQIQEDAARVKALGVTELFFDPTLEAEPPGAEAYLAWLERVPKLVAR